MSIADPRARRRERGFTAIELAVTTVLMGLMTLVIERTVSGVQETERTIRAIRNTAERSQAAIYRVRDIVSSSRRLYGNDATGNGYLAALDLGTLPRLTGSRLPTFDEVNPLGPDVAGSPYTGNVLLFVREADPLPVVVTPATKATREIDAYRIVCVYLTQTNRRLVSGGPYSLDLVEWRSASFPSYLTVSQITSPTQRATVVAGLYTRYGHDFLWDPSKPIGSAFYAINGSGTIAATPTAVTSVQEDRNVSRGGRFLAANVGVTRTDLTSWPRTPIFTAEPIATWTPNGFEVKVAGTSGHRKVWMRLSVEQQASKGRVPAHVTSVVARARDL